MITEWLLRFMKKHIIDDFPYPAECFDCNKGSCSGCEKKQDEMIVIRVAKIKSKGGEF